MTAQGGSESVDVLCVAAPHIQYISHISSWQTPRTIRASTLGKLPSFIALHAVWISGGGRGHWPFCQGEKTPFLTLYLLFHLRLIHGVFLSCCQFQVSPSTEILSCTLTTPVWSLKD